MRCLLTLDVLPCRRSYPANRPTWCHGRSLAGDYGEGSAEASLLEPGKRCVEDVLGMELALPDYPGRSAADDRARRNVFCHQCPCRHDSTAADSHARQDRGSHPNPDVILDHYRSGIIGKLGIVVEVLKRQYCNFRRDTHVVADRERAAGVQTTAAIDPAVVSDAQTVPAHVAGTRIPDKAVKKNGRAPTELDAQDVTIPEVPEREGRNVTNEIVRHVARGTDTD